jgi:hypothetical protein
MAATIASLRAQVKAAQEEFDLTVALHEVWRPAAYDLDLRKRMGVSYATNAFHVVRVACRREVLLGLTRLWDKRKDAIRIDITARSVCAEPVIAALSAERATRFSARADVLVADIEGQMRNDMNKRGKEALALAKRAGVRGERTEGHPNFRAPHAPMAAT